MSVAKGKNGRGGEIRTHDLLYPKQARYQATLRPEPEQEQGGERSAFLQSFLAQLIPQKRRDPVVGKNAKN
jgi:hypothetical protein